MNNQILPSTPSAKILSIVSTKGGVGKTTTAANLSALLADAGKKVLLIDLDSQPTLTSYFNLAYEKSLGTYEFLALNNKNLPEIISKTTIPNLDIIISNDYQNQLNRLLADGTGGYVRLFNLVPFLKPHYDAIIIDTQGARCATLEVAIIASTMILSPVPPEMLAAREFQRGTLQLIKDLIEGYSNLGIHIPTIQLFINRADFSTTDSKMIANALIESFKDNKLVKVLTTCIPAIATYRKASTIQTPAHRYETKKPYGRVAAAALESMKLLAVEIFPDWAEDINKLTPDFIKELTDKDLTHEVA